MESQLKIMLAGCSGVGKTTLAKHISESLNIPFISGSYSDLVPETAEITHADMVMQDAATIMQQDYKLLSLRGKQCDVDRFITDRSPLDSAAYWINKLSHQVPSCETEQFMEACKQLLDGKCTHLIFIPYSRKFMNNWEIEDNQKRILNPHYQFQISQLIYGVLELWGYQKIRWSTLDQGFLSFTNSNIKVLILDELYYHNRIEKVSEFLKRKI